MDIQVIYNHDQRLTDSAIVTLYDVQLAIRLFNNRRYNWESDSLNEYDETVRDLMLAGF